MKRVALVGAGVVGSSWSLVFARAGFEVAVYDADPRSAVHAKEFLVKALGDLAGLGLGLAEGPEAIAARVKPTARLEDALDGVSYVQESAPERVEIKIELYKTLDRIAPSETILASSTSGLPASAFTERLKHRARCLVVHPINPPHLVPLVEIVPAPWTETMLSSERAC